MQFWDKLETIQFTIDNCADILRRIEQELPEYPGPDRGSAIVTCAGGARYNPNAYVNIRLLRHLGVGIPIYVYYLGQNEYDPLFQATLKDYDVHFVDLREINETWAYKYHILNGWECKAAAITHCPARHILFLDSDCFPDRDPTFAFASPEYKANGAIFCPDVGIMPPDRNYWKAFALDPSIDGGQECEAGAVYIDKQRNWKPLIMNRVTQGRSDFFYNNGISFGDKDAMLACWRFLKQPYTLVKPCGAAPGTLVQHGVDGKPLFWHRVLSKFSINEDNSIDGFLNNIKLGQQCLKFLEELKDQWSPFYASLADHDKIATKELVGSEWIYHRIGHDSRKVMFLKDGRIKGGGACEKAYFMRDGVLHIAGDCGQKGVIAHLKPFEHGFVGKWITNEKMITVLEKK